MDSKKTPERKKRQGSVSEYKKSLTEKQSLKRLYGLSEKQFKRYVLNALEKMQHVENVSDELISNLERRLDNTIFRMGVAKSRSHARQMVSHAYFLVNGKPVNIPSFKVTKGDVISVKENKKKNPMFNDLADQIKKMETHTWLSLDKSKIEGRILGNPSLAEVNPPIEISMVFEFYSM